MATTAPEPRHPTPAGSTRSSPTGDPGTGEPTRGCASRPPAAPADAGPVDGRGRRAGRRRGRGRPAGVGRDELRTSGPRSSAAPPRSTRRTAPEFGTWTQRETGAVHSKMHHEQNFAAGEINAAATMPLQPYGSARADASCQGRLSMLRRVPVGVDRRDHAVELADRARDARRRAGTRPRQRRHPQARPADAGLRRRGVRGRLPRSRAARRAAPRSSSAAPRSARRSSPTPTSTVVSFTGSTAAGRRVGSSPAACSSGSASSSAATTRSSSSTTRTSAAAMRPARSPRSSSRARSASRPAGTSSTEQRGRDYVDLLPEKASGSGSATRTARTSSSGRSSTRSSSSGSTGSCGARSTRRRPARRRRHARGPVLPPDRPDRRHADHAAWREEIFGPVAPVVVFDTDDEALALANDSEYGLTGAVYSSSISRGLALAQRFRPGMVHVNDQTVNDEATIPFGGMGASGNGARFRWPGELGRVHRVAVGDGARGPAHSVPVLNADARRSMASITEVARLAGVSTATASRVVSLATTRSAPPRASASSRPPGRSTTCPTPWRAACSRAGCRSWA